MCGIFGVMSKDKLTKWQERKAFIVQALIANSFRGTDSTGIFLVNEDKEIYSYKKAMPGWDFTQMAPLQALLNNVDKYPFIVGHNRAATKGAVSAANAHPFLCGHIIGVHNGSLWNHKDLKGCRGFTVDSEAIFHSIATNGTEETLKELDGSFALVWYDQQTNLLNMVRNEERPMYFASVKDHKTILFASEAGMLKWLAARNGMVLETVCDLKPGVLLSFNMETLEVVSKEVKFKEKPVYVIPSKKNKNEHGSYVSLHDLGYRHGEEIMFRASYFVPSGYNQGNTGELVGRAIEQPYDMVKLYNVRKKDGGEWVAEGKNIVLRAPAVGVLYKNNPIIILDSGKVTILKRPDKVASCINCEQTITNPTERNQTNGGQDHICNDCVEDLLLGAC